MWDTVVESTDHLTHDRPCPRCGHAAHRYLACSDTCDCQPPDEPGAPTDEGPGAPAAEARSA